LLKKNPVDGATGVPYARRTVDGIVYFVADINMKGRSRRIVCTVMSRKPAF
jgi:hypothetical protein